MERYSIANFGHSPVAFWMKIGTEPPEKWSPDAMEPWSTRFLPWSPVALLFLGPEPWSP